MTPAERIRAAFLERVILYDGLPLETPPAPYVLDAAVETECAAAAEAVVEAVEHLARRYLEDEGLRRLLALPPAVDRAIREVDPGYARAVPIARIDGHLAASEAGPRFVAIESNTDGTAGMHEQDVVDATVAEVSPEAVAGLRRPGPADGRGVRGIRDRAVDALLAAFDEARPGVRPSVAVVDWREERTLCEFQAMAAGFVARGLSARFCDVRDLVFEGGRLVGGPRGDGVDLVYRRVLGIDLAARAREAEVFWRAYRERAAVFVGSLRSEVGWTKACLAVLTDPERNGFLPDGLRRRLEGRIAETRVLDPGVAEAVLRERGEWVLKPRLGSGGRGVVVGRDASPEAWAAAVRAGADGGAVVQRRIEPEARAFDGYGDLRINLSPFVFGGRYAGLHVRGGRRDVVDVRPGTFTLAGYVRPG